MLNVSSRCVFVFVFMPIVVVLVFEYMPAAVAVCGDMLAVFVCEYIQAVCI